MRIGIDCRTILSPNGECAGIGYYDIAHPRAFGAGSKKYVRALLRRRDARFLFASASNVVMRMFPRKQSIPFISSHVLPAGMIRKNGLTFFMAMNVLPIGIRGKTVVTVHDLLIYTHPEWFPSGQWASKRVIVPRSIRRANHVIAVSEHTRREVLRRFSVDPSYVSVIPEGGLCSEPKSALSFKELQKNSIFRSSLLFIGTIEPRKNLVRLVRAFDDFVEKGEEAYRRFSVCDCGEEGVEI